MVKPLWKCLSLICLCFLAIGGNTQQESNPFELDHRLKTKPPNTTQAVENSPSQQANPFDIQRGVDRKQPKPAQQTVPDQKPPVAKKTPSITGQSYKSFLFWVVALIIALLSMLLTLFRNTINKVYRAFLNDNFCRLLHREQGSFIGLPFWILYGFFILNASFFAFLLLNYYQVNTSLSLSKLMGICVLGVAGAFLLKHLLLNTVGYIFPVNKEIRLYSFTIVVFNIIIGLALVPFNLFIAFTTAKIAQFLILAAFGLLVAIYLFRSLRGVFVARRYLSFYKFHFFMYLCTVEIAPFAVILKLVLMQTGSPLQ